MNNYRNFTELTPEDGLVVRMPPMTFRIENVLFNPWIILALLLCFFIITSAGHAFFFIDVYCILFTGYDLLILRILNFENF